MVRTTTEDRTNSDLERLKSDIQKLREDLGEMLGSAGSYSREKLVETRGRLRAAVDDLQGKAYDRLHETARVVRDRGGRAAQASRSAVGQRPLTYVATAFAAGVILASFIGWKRS
jgi:ElaB/YqjD/DUF883 family membrane-anchored ribosome-binding protein